MDMDNYTLYITPAMPGWHFEDPPILTAYNFEKIDIPYWMQFGKDHWYLPYISGAVYITTIFGLQSWMKSRKPFDLNSSLFLWNAILGLFSIVGFARFAPSLFKVLMQENGFYRSICVREGMNVPTLYWGVLFIFSKLWELGDTVFIVLRKRPLIFLQWYHHLITLVTAFTVGPHSEPILRWAGAMNYGVHSLMYPYFALKALKIHVPNIVARTITTLQFAQMVMGLFINVLTVYLMETGYECSRNSESILTFVIVYGSFVPLFGKLLYGSLKAVKKPRKMENKKID